MIDQNLAFFLLLAFFFFLTCFYFRLCFSQTVGFGEALDASSKGFSLRESTVGSSLPLKSRCSFFPTSTKSPLWARCTFLLTQMSVSVAEKLVLLTAPRFLESLLTCRCEMDCSLALGR